MIWLDSVEYALLWDDKEEEEEEENKYEILMDDALDICELVLRKRYWVDRILTAGRHEGDNYVVS